MEMLLYGNWSIFDFIHTKKRNHHVGLWYHFVPYPYGMKISGAENKHGLESDVDDESRLFAKAATAIIAGVVAKGKLNRNKS